MFCQNCSRFLACGNCPAMPITAMRSVAGGADLAATTELGETDAMPANRDPVRLRQDDSFFVLLCCTAIFFCEERLFSAGTGMLLAGDVTACERAPCFPASSLILRLNCFSVG